MALKAGMAAAAVEEYDTLRRWVVTGRVPPLSAPYEKLLARKLTEARPRAAAPPLPAPQRPRAPAPPRPYTAAPA